MHHIRIIIMIVIIAMLTLCYNFIRLMLLILYYRTFMFTILELLKITCNLVAIKRDLTEF